MEGPEEEVGAPTEGENVAPELPEMLTASENAVAFMYSIEPAELVKCVSPDTLDTVSEGGRHLGKFTVTVDFAHRQLQPCVMLHAQSKGAIDDSPCGTTVTTYLSGDLEVLEEEYHEYVKIEGHNLDRRCHMLQQDGQMVVNKVTVVGEEVSKVSVSYPMSDLRGLVTEGSNLILMRLLALRKKVPKDMMCICFDSGLHIIQTSFTQLSPEQMEVRGRSVEVFGVQRIVHSVVESPTTWHCYYLPDGHLASRVQLGSPIMMMRLDFPSEEEQGPEKIPLVWEEDMQLHSKFLDRKAELKADHALYLRQHPEIRALVSDFLQFLLLRKPEDVFTFAKEYFLPFTNHRPPESSQSL
ncbi:ciliogenesis-associated TTC17-interacting protein [Neosynchiropus ocellatus]